MVQFKGKNIRLTGSFIRPGNIAMNFVLVNQKLENITLEAFQSKKKVLITVPSIDTQVCATETKRLEEVAIKYPEIAFLIISKDLPFAFDRFCRDQHIYNINTLSDLRPNSRFGSNYGVLIDEGPMEGLLARSIIVLDASDRVIYTELVEEITHEPNYEALENALSSKD